ncbi:Ca-activated chloride channel family protein [Loktanella salsilacus]|uniref:Ca-activated chloride channel family protein n=1 Tax=Loktanella salsilacus TaxID=195913 RepID=A0A1I4IAG3_9RHOB|nr:Ca-activated chloride channel family protein [Loktanella salsilacus]
MGKVTGLRGSLALCLALLPSLPAKACDVALLLAIDVSNSVDSAEYRLQVDGLADALTDPAIIDALVAGNSAISVVQWSGIDRQSVTLPWSRIATARDVAALSQSARLMPRAYTLSGTAPAEAILFSLANFGPVPDCSRRVIDISGDGTPNIGADVASARQQAQRDGITINAIAIESMGLAITNFYARQVITRDGFVVTARRHRDYPRAIRAKILRELAKAIS